MATAPTSEPCRLARELGVAGHVEFRGPVPKANLPSVFAESDIFLNTTNVDNTPVTVVEALASGLCVVSTSVGGIPYLVQHERDALLVPADDPAGDERRDSTNPDHPDARRTAVHPRTTECSRPRLVTPAAPNGSACSEASRGAALQISGGNAPGPPRPDVSRDRRPPPLDRLGRSEVGPTGPGPAPPMRASRADDIDGAPQPENPGAGATRGRKAVAENRLAVDCPHRTG